MNDLQKKYLRITRDGDISLSMWAHLAEHTDPGNIDKLWTSCGSPFLRTLGEKGNRAHRRLCALGIDERMTIWAKVKEMKDHQDAMRSKASHQIQMAADDVTAEIASISAMKHKLLEGDSDVTTPNKKPHMDTVVPTSEDQQQQQEQYQLPSGEESDTASTISASTIIAITTSSSSSGGKASAVSAHTFFDPMKDPLSAVFLGGIDIGPPFSQLQLESAEIVNDLSKKMNLQLLPLFLAANFIWHTGQDLPGLSDKSCASVQEALSVPVQQISKELVMFCYDLDQEMATTGWIKSRVTETREQDELLILFQQVCKKLPTKYVSAGLHKNEDSHAHSTFDALMTSVFPGNHRHFELHWANRKSKGSGDRRGGDHLALKPDATITKDCYELGYVELKPPREDRNQRYFLEDVWALAGFAKDCIDNHLRHGHKITNVACLHVFGYQMTLYQLSFHVGIYVWQDVSTAYLPRDHYDSGCTLQCLQLLRTFKNILSDVDVQPYLRTPPRKDQSLPDMFRPRPTNITPTTRPFFERSRSSSITSTKKDKSHLENHDPH